VERETLSPKYLWGGGAESGRERGRRRWVSRSIPNALSTGGAALSWAIEEGLATVTPFHKPGKVFKVESF
jgi:hypothetical protein